MLEAIVRNVGPFPGVREAIDALRPCADVVVSSTTQEVLIRELDHCGIRNCFDAVGGQESGTKTICIRTAMGKGYAPDHVLKVDDAPGDHQVAVNVFPIIPGVESESWRNLREEVIGRFVAGTYQGAPMAEQLERFYTVLEDEPGWEK